LKARESLSWTHLVVEIGRRTSAAVCAVPASLYPADSVCAAPMDAPIHFRRQGVLEFWRTGLGVSCQAHVVYTGSVAPTPPRLSALSQLSQSSHSSLSSLSARSLSLLSLSRSLTLSLPSSSLPENFFVSQPLNVGYSAASPLASPGEHCPLLQRAGHCAALRCSAASACAGGGARGPVQAPARENRCGAAEAAWMGPYRDLPAAAPRRTTARTSAAATPRRGTVMQVVQG
jgi:hypothetical protein